MALVRVSKLWGRRDVPFVITRTAQSNSGANIQSAVNDWNYQTVINLIPLLQYLRRHGWTYSWIRFTYSTGRCNSPVGRQGGVQDIKCGGTSIRSLVHEIGHAIGLYHEQMRPERDRFVFVVEEQMSRNEYSRNYKKKYPPYSVPHGRYDCRSVMHYARRTKTQSGSTFAFFNRLPWGCAAIGAQSRTRRGRQTWLSNGDIAAINAYY